MSRSTKQKIGIFSGTFDPIHDGHIQFALDAIADQGLDKVYFMVERRPRRKQGVRAFEHRQTMVQLAIEDEPKLGSIITDQQQFTAHQTLPILRKRFGDSVRLVLLAGDDMLSHMNEWPHVKELIQSVEFIFGVRGQRSLARERIDTIQNTRNMTFRYTLLSSGLHNVSSSRIRSQIKNHEKPSYVDKGVASYIREQGLYSSSSADSAKN
ncbi:MAG: nicotinate-nicotinamide nucleotide adenylyltransferase [Candidatus Saccharibacteria bacterium]|nr:nicotinate-nicotinamide nucleotide adenylyltransferase [Candidatus Saccharibacteria bacterium]